ncbi:CRISPR-associated endoribonuclease Cas6 [Candidatus Poribacteria bacterium]|nr:MAG: CRISPR-associated endoribonuclease Cas6 [Candidatus Poribacteria bacterium]
MEVLGVRLRIVFSFPGPSLVRWGYLNRLRGLIYAAVRGSAPEVAREVHELGLSADGKVYKPFTFSYLFPRRGEAHRDGIVVWGEVEWFFSTPIPALAEALAAGLLMMEEVRIGDVACGVERVEVMPPPECGGEMEFKTLSPVVASTGVRRGGKFEKVFLRPDQPDFARVLRLNLRRKHLAFYGGEPGGDVEFEFHPPFKSKMESVRGTKVRGFQMRLTMRGDPSLMRVAYEMGLGERNGQGFGMIEVAGRGRG